MEPTTGPRHHSSPRAESVAARLAALTGSTPRITTDGARTRVEADLPPRLTNAECRMLYLALAATDHCGINPDGQVWAELLELPALGRLTADQCAGYACALCGAGLYTTRFLGSIDGLQLWACAPACQANPLASG
ncbi:hypothetical protein [Streptomyces asiaticus]|uniref:hypothetical protein n=1 Tax=Streptomyces asiaticus TaxID=114695 RepID=UPI001BAA8B41|nr:hypothetical protein [Streptomyces asiaticus]